MIGLLCFVLAVLASPFKSKIRLVASASNGSAIRRLNGAGNLRRSDSIRHRRQPRPKVRNYGGQKVGITGAVRSNFVLQARLPGTEFLDAETGHQKPPLKCVNARRDKNPRNEWSEIPAETRYLASCRKRAVCGDWMVVCAVRYEPVSAAIPHWKPRQSAVFRFL